MQADFVRTLVIGNSGSGKGWIAGRIARSLDIGMIDLDTIRWDGAGYRVARDKDAAREIVRRTASEPRWVMEGVHGWLAAEAADRATALIWLDLAIDLCLDDLKARGPRGGDKDGYETVLEWTAQYGTRQDSTSFSGHLSLFAAHRGRKVRLRSRAEMNEFLAETFAD